MYRINGWKYILPRYYIPKASTALQELTGGLSSCLHFMVLEGVEFLEFHDAMGSVCLAKFLAVTAKTALYTLRAQMF
jgi:hypothetical protein